MRIKPSINRLFAFMPAAVAIVPIVFGKTTFGFSVFNPDDSDNRLAIASLGAEF